MKILALDYDGVIVDSKNEGLFTGYKVYLRFNPKTKIFGGKKLTFNNWRKVFEKYKSLHGIYIQYRNYVRNEMDYYYSLYAIENNLKVKSAKDFDIISKKIGVDKQKYKEMFYRNRLIYIKNHFEQWIKLMPLYPKIMKILKKLDLKNTFISTANRKSTILKTFSHFKFDFKSKNIIDNTVGADKQDHMRQIKNIKRVKYQDIFLVDDILTNLLRVKHLGIRCYLATWGYNDEEQRKEAKRKGIELVNLDNFYEKIMHSK